MKKFKYVLISSIIIFILHFPAHFTFDVLPYTPIGYFFPVNESIFEHMKMIFTCFMIFYLILGFFKERMDLNNLLTGALVSSITTIISFLIVYLPIVLIFKENMLVTFILLFLAINLGEFISTFIIYRKDYKSANFISLFIILLIFIFNAYLTYNPLKNFFFLDKKHHTYGVVYKN